MSRLTAPCGAGEAVTADVLRWQIRDEGPPTLAGQFCSTCLCAAPDSGPGLILPLHGCVPLGICHSSNAVLPCPDSSSRSA